MHFFYLDETGCTGTDLLGNIQQQPVFVLGGISVRDEGWRKTYSEFQELIATFFGAQVPPGFELHAAELLAPNGEGPFAGIDRERRNGLALAVLELLVNRGHDVHFIGLDKAKLHQHAVGNEHCAFNSRVPYLLAYNYLVSYIERICKERLGRSARGMIIVDPKEQFDPDVQRLIHYRRYEAPASSALKWVVEFSYAIDSTRHPMIQMSDLVIFLVRKFLEIENGYRENAPEVARTFFARCYEKILPLVGWKDVIPHNGRPEKRCHELIDATRSTHRLRWKHYYQFD